MQFEIWNIYPFGCNFQIKYLRASILDDFALKQVVYTEYYKKVRFPMLSSILYAFIS